ncbi:polysaccharide biosynthesis tyrosine autokinase [Rhodobacter sp. CZR27]|uniref:GumC family protein n=1 Tax=Rhodobacter sp. CZR27 TaxID=2033869 RepID=UPI000BBE6C6F|nr:polysaccharide biosynthesis tyrosine autokinase [Rhodobacter sp. CZR27]
MKQTIPEAAARPPLAEDKDARQRMAVVEAVDLGFAVEVLRRRKWQILASGAIAVAGMFAAISRMEPTYTAYAQVILDTRQERVTDVKQVVSDLDVTNPVIAGEIVSLKSNTLIGKVVDRLGLTSHPEFALEGGETIPEAEKRRITILRIAARLTVTQVGISYAIGIAFKASDPKLASLVANTLAKEYIADQVETKRNSTLRATAWLQKRLGELSTAVEAADQAILDLRARTADENGANQETTERFLVDLNQRLVTTASERSDATVRYEIVTKRLEQAGLTSVAHVVSSPLLETLQRERIEIAREQASNADRLGRRHPEMIRLNARLQDLDRRTEAEVRRIIENMKSDVDVATQREQALQDQIRQIEKRLVKLSAAAVKLNQLERQASATRMVYENFLSRLTETNAQSDFQRPDARIVTEATPPDRPTAPRKKLLLAVAGVFGLSFGTALAFLIEALSRRIHASDDLRRITASPVMGLIPYEPRRRRNPGWLSKELTLTDRSPYMEAISALRAQLFDVRSLGRPKVLMMTSALQGEGKSSTCAALAVALTRVSTSAIMIDLDLRRSITRKVFDLTSQRGCVADYLAGGIDLAQLQPAELPSGLTVLAPLRSVSNSADLLSSPRLGELINRLRLRYDVVLIDAPPVLDIADALVVSRHADSTLLVVRSGKTPRTLVEDAYERLQGADVPVIGTILTQVRKGHTAAREMYRYDYA